MKITETRKTIIKLIKSYMDKTETENDLFLYKRNISTDIFKPIGHYDITAVFKYMNKRGQLFDLGDELCWKDYKKGDEHCIPNKPLHLYTEEEDKQLLELLTKLK